MTIVNEEVLKRSMLLVPCISKEALDNWFKLFLGVQLFNTKVSRYDSSCPLDAAWELYNFAVHTKDKTPKQYMYASARNTQKTLLLAALETVVALHTSRSAVHFAAYREQVKPARKYMEDFTKRPYIRDLVIDEPTQDIIKYHIPTSDNPYWLDGRSAKEIMQLEKEKKIPSMQLRETVIEVVGISAATTQGKHYSILSVDEPGSLKGEKLSFYNDIKKIPTASWRGDPYFTFKIGTRRSAFSIVEKEIKEKDITGLNVRTWSVFVGIEKCLDSRSGIDWVNEMYINTLQGKMVSPEDYHLLKDKEKKDYESVNLASGCLTCPLAPVCKGDAKKQKSNSAYLQSIDAAVVEFASSRSDLNFYLSQCLSMMPSAQGLVFPNYSADMHYIDANEMYEKFMGEPPQTPQNIQSLVSLFISKGLKCHVGLDFGFTHPQGFSVHYTDEKERVFTVYAVEKTGMEPDKDTIPFLRKLEAQFGRFKIHPDSARPDLIKMIETAGFTVMDTDKDTDASVEVMRKMIINAQSKPAWFLLKDHTGILNDQMLQYHYELNTDGTSSEEIFKEFDDTLDSVRYFFLNVFFNKSTVIMAGSKKDAIVNQPATKQNFVAQQIYKHLSDATTLNPGEDKAGNKGSFSWSFGDLDE